MFLVWLSFLTRRMTYVNYRWKLWSYQPAIIIFYFLYFDKVKELFTSLNVSFYAMELDLLGKKPFCLKMSHCCVLSWSSISVRETFFCVKNNIIIVLHFKAIWGISHLYGLLAYTRKSLLCQNSPCISKFLFVFNFLKMLAGMINFDLAFEQIGFEVPLQWLNDIMEAFI